MNSKASKKVLAVVLTVVLLLSVTAFAMPVEAWPWRDVWLTFTKTNTVGAPVDGIAAGGISLLSVKECLKGKDPKFPNCYKFSHNIGQYVGFKWVGFLTGQYYGKEKTNPGVKRRIGIKCRCCAAMAGFGLWLDGFVPKGWFPLIGIRCTSPVELVVGDEVPEPIIVEDVEFAVIPEPVPFDELEYHHYYFSYIPWQSVNLTPPYDPGESIPLNITTEIGDNVLVIRGTLAPSSDQDDKTFFAAEIVVPPPEEVPAITPLSFLLALLSLFGLGAIAMRKVHKR